MSSSPLSLRALNTQPATATRPALLACCPSRAWAEELMQHRPFGSLEQLLLAADAAWRAIGADQWKAAAAAAGAVGASKGPAAPAPELLAAFIDEEQRCILQSPSGDQAALQSAREQYARRFGRAPVQAVYGQSASACAAALQQRLAHTPEQEVGVSMEEQSRITQRRLGALLASQPTGSSALTAGAAAPSSSTPSPAPIPVPAIAAAAPAPAPAAAPAVVGAPGSGLNIAVSTHVLNTSNGLPAANIRVTFEAQSSSNRSVWESLGSARTNSDGRIGSFPPIRTTEPTANYRLVFDAEEYFAQLGVAPAFFPHITIQWQVSQQHDHARAKLHVPLLLSPFGYSTYRGS